MPIYFGFDLEKNKKNDILKNPTCMMKKWKLSYISKNEKKIQF